MAKRSKADTELLLIKLQQMSINNPEMTPKEQQQELGISSSNYYTLVKRLKDRGGISKGDMDLASRFVNVQKSLNETTEKLTELQAAIRNLPEEVYNQIREEVLRGRRATLQIEMEEHIDAIRTQFETKINDIDL